MHIHHVQVHHSISAYKCVSFYSKCTFIYSFLFCAQHSCKHNIVVQTIFIKRFSNTILNYSIRASNNNDKHIELMNYLKFYSLQALSRILSNSVKLFVDVKNVFSIKIITSIYSCMIFQLIYRLNCKSSNNIYLFFKENILQFLFSN